MSFRESDSSRHSRIKTMSVSVRRLQDALNMHLDIQEKTEFVEILNEFHITRDMPVFVKRLKQLLDTPAKKQMLPLIGKVIPKSDQVLFDQCLKLDGRKFGTMPSKPKRKSKLPKKDELLKAFQIKPKAKPEKVIKKDKESESLQSSREKVSTKSIRSQKSLGSVTKESGSEVRRVEVKQSNDPDQGFGFSIRGGSEYGIGIYVSMVDEGGMAQKQCLLPGDLLMEVNDVSFKKISHSEAAKVIRAARKLDITLCRVGRIPGTFVVHQMYRWVDPVGRTVSPPPELDRLGKTDSVGRKSGFSLLKDIDERKVNVVVEKGHRLGLMIRGGREFGLGIYISGVDQFSRAEEAGLKVGDQILDVNGESFLDITHAEAVRVLKMSKHLMFTIKDVGKLPFGRTKVDRTNWWNRKPPQRLRTESQHSGSTANQSQTTSVFSKGIGSQLIYNSAISTKWDMIENQARELLNNTEQGTLRYYLSEYQKGYITVDGLLLASFELLNTKAKMTLLDEIRNLVQAQDLDKFDALRERREMRQRQGFLPESFSTLSLDSQSDRHVHAHRPRSERSFKTSRSEPFTRSQSARDLTGRRRKLRTESDLDSLRQAIEQIEDDPDWVQDLSSLDEQSNHQLLSSSMRSLSNEHLPSYHRNPLSLASHNRSLSVEALTPLSINTSYGDQPPGHRRSRRNPSRTSELKIATGTKVSRDTSPRPRSNSNPPRKQRLPLPDSVAHRQRAASVSSSIHRQHKSVDDLRQQKPKRTPIPLRAPNDDMKDRVSSQPTVTLLKHIPGYRSPVPSRHKTENVVYAEVHQQPRVAKDSPSDDSGVEVNGHYDTQQMDRVTISRETPVDIDDVLERRSSVFDTSFDDHHTNDLLPTTSYNNSITARPSPRSHRKNSMDIPTFRQNYPPEIRLNDGDGSIDTMSFDTTPSPKFISQSGTSLNRLSYFDQSHSRIHDDDDSSLAESHVDDDEEPYMYEFQSENGDDTDFFVSSLDKVLDDEDYDLDNRKIVDAKKKYGDIPLEVIPVYKTKPTLGMAIEGGANTRQPLPRVINIQPGGSAYESGGLKVGHVILEVNSECLVGLEHIAAAKTIAECFKNKSSDQMDLLVTESDVVLKKTKPQEFQV